MKFVELFHNPGAGDKDHTKKELTRLLKENGYECRYLSTKSKSWKDFDAGADFLIIAGGDGTVRRVTKELLNRKLLDKPRPIALLPLGTANNISNSLGITGEVNEIIESWKIGKTKRFDVGRVYYVPDTFFFLEGLGYGIFPCMIKKMMDMSDGPHKSPEEHLQKALEVLNETIHSYNPHYCQLEVNGTDYSEKFLLVEVMNTRCIGPNLCISPLADPGDGEFEVVAIPESQREKFASYVSAKINGLEETYSFQTLKGTIIKIGWEGSYIHVDDKLIKLQKNQNVSIELKKGLIEFLIP